MNTNFTMMTVEQRLPCGCMIRISNVEDGDRTDASWIYPAAEKLAWYIADRVPRHDCKLVSKENPNGIAPKVKK